MSDSDSNDQMNIEDLLEQALVAVESGSVTAAEAIEAAPEELRGELELCVLAVEPLSEAQTTLPTPGTDFRASALAAAFASLDAAEGTLEDAATSTGAAPTEQIPLPTVADLDSARQAREAEKSSKSSSIFAGRGVLLGAAASLMLLLGGTSYAASGSLPGSPLYPVKIAQEKVKIAVSVSKESRVRALLQTAESRLGEIRELQKNKAASGGRGTGLARAALAADRMAISVSGSDEASGRPDAEMQASFARQRALLSQVYADIDRRVFTELTAVIGDPAGGMPQARPDDNRSRDDSARTGSSGDEGQTSGPGKAQPKADDSDSERSQEEPKQSESQGEGDSSGEDDDGSDGASGSGSDDDGGSGSSGGDGDSGDDGGGSGGSDSGGGGGDDDGGGGSGGDSGDDDGGGQPDGGSDGGEAEEKDSSDDDEPSDGGGGDDKGDDGDKDFTSESSDSEDEPVSD